MHDIDVWVHPSSVELLDKETAQKTTWFHTTSIEHWEVKILEHEKRIPYVHAGTLEAALDRFEHQKNSYGWVYELQLSDDCILADEVYEDHDRWDYSVQEGFTERDGIVKHAIRYINRWESVGSISILLDPRRMKVVGKRKIGAHPPTKEETRAILKEFAMV